MIYIHVPFCHRKCTYCAFCSRPVGTGEQVELYIDSLLAEMVSRCAEAPQPIRTLYFGGGTPSLLPVKELRRVVKGLHTCFDLSVLEEVTLEANPEDLTPRYLDELRSVGIVNRLSIGVQSLDDATLRHIGRRHSGWQALQAVRDAHAAGFDNITVDLIYGLPGLTVEAWERTLRQVLQMPEVKHLSAYSLTVEEDTALAVQVGQGRVSLSDEDEVLRQYHTLLRVARDEGFEQYEVSNFCRPGFNSRHNSRYWDRTPYLGLGPGAHSFDGHRRAWNHADISDYARHYLGANAHAVRPPLGEELTPADAWNELVMTALRTTRGLPLADMPLQLYYKVKKYVDCGWLRPDGPCLRPTEEGLLHADGMAADLFVG